jgi:hypothetical protein
MNLSIIFSVLAVAAAISVLLCDCTIISVSAFQVQPSVSSITRTLSSSSTSLNVFGKKKPSAAELAKLDLYWQGEWVCKDCGYIYNRVSDI